MPLTVLSALRPPLSAVEHVGLEKSVGCGCMLTYSVEGHRSGGVVSAPVLANGKGRGTR